MCLFILILNNLNYDYQNRKSVTFVTKSEYIKDKICQLNNRIILCSKEFFHHQNGDFR
jgi:hypothetical protein